MGLRVTSSFVAKALAAAALVVLGDRLFWAGDGIGSNLGWFGIAWTIVTLFLTRAIWRNRGALIAAAIAIGLGFVMAYSPGVLALVLFWSALSLAALLPRVGGFDHAGRWVARLAIHGATSIIGPWLDLIRLRRIAGGKRMNREWLLLLPLPLIGGAIFLALFASANPLISEALTHIVPPNLDVVTIIRLVFWSVLFTVVWATLRPRKNWISLRAGTRNPVLPLPGVTPASVLLALITFNALFALQNGLDLAFLWSGAALPEGVTLADYAHRGAYPLIATALLAGLFVLVTLRPGSATAAVPAIRRLVVLWIVQNVFLVSSSILRTLDYIQVYSLTELRIAALIWMALVAVGLVLVVWRMLQGRSGAWLINANALATLLVLSVCTALDLGSIAATWNVRHAREVGGKGAAIDLCYLNELGPSALTAVVALEQRPGLKPDFAARIAWVRHRVLTATVDGQKRGEWTWRNARRLIEMQTMLHGQRLKAPPLAGPTGRGCDGAVLPPSMTEQPAPPLAEQSAAPGNETALPLPEPALTNEAEQ